MHIMGPVEHEQAMRAFQVRMRLFYPHGMPIIELPPPCTLELPKIAPLPKPMTDEERIIEIMRRAAGARTAAVIRDHAAKVYCVPVSALQSRSRAMPITKVRMITMALCAYMLRTHRLCSKQYISRAFGGRDHTTVLNAIYKFGELIERAAATVPPPSQP